MLSRILIIIKEFCKIFTSESDIMDYLLLLNTAIEITSQIEDTFANGTPIYVVKNFCDEILSIFR